MLGIKLLPGVCVSLQGHKISRKGFQAEFLPDEDSLLKGLSRNIWGSCRGKDFFLFLFQGMDSLVESLALLMFGGVGSDGQLSRGHTSFRSGDPYTLVSPRGALARLSGGWGERGQAHSPVGRKSAEFWDPVSRELS